MPITKTVENTPPTQELSTWQKWKQDWIESIGSFMGLRAQVVLTPEQSREAMGVKTWYVHARKNFCFVSGLKNGMTVDCRDIPPTSPIKLHLQNHVTELDILTAEHAEVTRSYRYPQVKVGHPIRIITPTDTHALRNYIYWVNHQHLSLNAYYHYERPASFSYGQHQASLVNNYPVYCRHIAMTALILQHYRGEETRRQHFEGVVQGKDLTELVSLDELERNYINMRYYSPSFYRIDSNDLGSFMRYMLEGMSHGANSVERTFFMETFDYNNIIVAHAMILTLKVKKDTGRPIYQLKLYDPNHTFNHVRCLSHELCFFEFLNYEKLGIQEYKANDTDLYPIYEHWYKNPHRDNLDTQLCYTLNKTPKQPVPTVLGFTEPAGGVAKYFENLHNSCLIE